MVKIRRSRLLQPGELIFGTRRIPPSLAYRMRTFFGVAGARLLILAATLFLVDDLFQSSAAFDTMEHIASQGVWGIALGFVGIMCLVAMFAKSGRMGRAALVCSGTLMATAGASFLSIALQYDVGWWGVVAYFGLAAGDFITASYSGEKVK